MERQELQNAYNQYIEELALDTLARKPVNQNLVDMITKVQSDMRDMDIIEAMKKIRKSTIPKEEIYLTPKPIPKEEIYLTPKPIPKEEIYLTPDPNLKAAEFDQPMVAQPTFQMPQSNSQRISEELAKMTSPRAAEFDQPMAAQPDYSEDYKPRSK